MCCCPKLLTPSASLVVQDLREAGMAPEAEVKEELASPPRQQEPSPEKLIPVKGEEEQLQALQLACHSGDLS